MIGSTKKNQSQSARSHGDGVAWCRRKITRQHQQQYPREAETAKLATGEKKIKNRACVPYHYVHRRY